jgi:peptidoglycan/xylan/chitin deacetylase (PgdA/CDA1 family)
MIAVCFRLDDPSASSDHDLESDILELFARFHVPLCVAAIPFARDPDRESIPLSAQNAGHLLQAERAGVVEIAQHGHSHVHRGMARSGVRSEFAGVPAAEQARIIEEGRKHLEAVIGHEIYGFVPPWNTYDYATTEILAAAGFEYLSAGRQVIQHAVLPVIPSTCGLRDVRETAERALCFGELAPVLVVVFHPDDFEEFRSPPRDDEPPPFTSLRELAGLLDWVTTNRDVQLETISAIAQSVREGMPLRTTNEIRLPYRIKALIPSVLIRSDDWKTLAGVLLGAFRRRRLDA